LFDIGHAACVCSPKGTFCGYSALSLAEGLPQPQQRGGGGSGGGGSGGSLVTLEIDSEAAAIAQAHFDQSAELGPMIELVHSPK